MAASAAMGREDFEGARELVGMLKDGELKSQLTGQVNTRESLHLLGAGDLAGAERLARQLNNVSSIRQAYPPLIRRLAKQADPGRVRSAAARPEDRPQRLSVLAAVCRGEAERLAQKSGGGARR